MEFAEKLALANTKAKGKRPEYLLDKQTEQTLSITMALAMELHAANERVASLECLLEQKGIITRDELNNFQPDSEETAKRSLDTQVYLNRILRVLDQEKQAMATNDESVSEVLEKLKD
ncbi:hypothetical protein RGQ13_18770 [Thalassotalea psychrophila]|uniref:Terminase small subunit n=1 Tax=Thalassotalea psychrophila TaxID=3065647 RepID=A0ABY9TWJ4_9GAMM|nr:hypothetical protein RGQ13_18770 [Colwelliaceae bacterium SQ149]